MCFMNRFRMEVQGYTFKVIFGMILILAVSTGKFC